jgi:hypothetical protein
MREMMKIILNISWQENMRALKKEKITIKCINKEKTLQARHDLMFKSQMLIYQRWIKMNLKMKFILLSWRLRELRELNQLINTVMAKI